MIRACAVAAALLLAASCGSGGSRASVTPSPSVSWDAAGRRTCQDAKVKADAAIPIDAGMSSMVEIVALRDRPDLITAWCAENYHG